MLAFLMWCAATASKSSAAIVMQEGLWRSRATAHAERVRGILGGMTPSEASAAKENPIANFIFTYYYGFKPNDLTRWSPGAGVPLRVEGCNMASAKEVLARGDWIEGEGTLELGPQRHPKNLPSLEHTRETMFATSRRLPVRTCFGLHEWAMLYGDDDSSSRFQKNMPLRVTQAQLNAVVDAPGAMQCTHFDAFRFFTEDAKPLNIHRDLARERQPDYEQPGCVHASMDLFKYALRIFPTIPSELLADALSVALEARVLDMRASPYDLGSAFPPGNEFGIDPTPVAVETQAGRKQYADLQLKLSTRAAPIRAKLIDAYDRFLLERRRLLSMTKMRDH